MRHRVTTARDPDSFSDIIVHEVYDRRIFKLCTQVTYDSRLPHNALEDALALRRSYLG